jgi:hypothetical protein
MDTKTALEVKQALLTLSDVLDIEFQQVAARVCLLDEGRGAILKEASDKWNEFDDADIVARGAMLGLTVTEV